MSNETYKSDAIQPKPINFDKVDLVCPREILDRFRAWASFDYEEDIDFIREVFQYANESESSKSHCEGFLWTLLLNAFNMGYSTRQAEIDRGRAITEFAKTMKDAADAFDAEFGINR